MLLLRAMPGSAGSRIARLPHLGYYFFGPFSMERALKPFELLEPFPAKAGTAARVRTAGVTYAIFFNSSLRLVRISKTVWEFSINIKAFSDSQLKTRSLVNTCGHQVEQSIRLVNASRLRTLFTKISTNGLVVFGSSQRSPINSGYYSCHSCRQYGESLACRMPRERRLISLHFTPFRGEGSRRVCQT